MITLADLAWGDFAVGDNVRCLNSYGQIDELWKGKIERLDPVGPSVRIEWVRADGRPYNAAIWYDVRVFNMIVFDGSPEDELNVSVEEVEGKIFIS